MKYISLMKTLYGQFGVVFVELIRDGWRDIAMSLRWSAEKFTSHIKFKMVNNPLQAVNLHQSALKSILSDFLLDKRYLERWQRSNGTWDRS